MSEARIEPELQRVLRACLTLAGTPNRICYSWVEQNYKHRFGGTFHPSRLRQLEGLGVLAKDGDTSRGGHRRYYRIVEPLRFVELLKEP